MGAPRLSRDQAARAAATRRRVRAPSARPGFLASMAVSACLGVPHGLGLTTTSSSYTGVVLLEVVDISRRYGYRTAFLEVIACTVRSAVTRTAGLSTAG